MKKSFFLFLYFISLSAYPGDKMHIYMVTMEQLKELNTIISIM